MAASSVQSCPFPDPTDLCKSLTSQIENAVTGGTDALQDAAKQAQQAAAGAEAIQHGEAGQLQESA